MADTPGDFSLLVDTDGRAYHVQTTTNDPHDLRGFVITTLNASYTGPDPHAPTATLHAPVPAEGPVFFRRQQPGPGNTTVLLYYILAGSTCCACRGGSNIVVFSAPAPLGPWTFHGDVGSNPQAQDPHSPQYVSHPTASTRTGTWVVGGSERASCLSLHTTPHRFTRICNVCFSAVLIISTPSIPCANLTSVAPPSGSPHFTEPQPTAATM